MSMDPEDLPQLAQGYRISRALYAACALRVPDAVAGLDQTVIVICNEGYSSSLAAVSLHQLG